MPRLLDKRVIGGSDDVINRTYDAAPPGYVLKVSDSGRTLDLGPPVGFTGSQGVQGPTGPAGGPPGPVGTPGTPGAPGSAGSMGFRSFLSDGPGSFTVPPGTTAVVVSAIGGAGSGSDPILVGDPGDGAPQTFAPGVPGNPGAGWLISLGVQPGDQISWSIGLGSDVVATNGAPTVVTMPGVGPVPAFGGAGYQQFFGFVLPTPAPYAPPPAGFAILTNLGGLYGRGMGGDPGGVSGLTFSPGYPGIPYQQPGRPGGVFLQWVQS